MDFKRKGGLQGVYWYTISRNPYPFIHRKPEKSTPLEWNLTWSFRSGMGEGWGAPNGTSLFSVDINTISKVARHLVMKNKNWNLLQLEMGKYFRRIIRIIIYILL